MLEAKTEEIKKEEPASAPAPAPAPVPSPAPTTTSTPAPSEVDPSEKDITKNKEFLESLKELKALASKDGPTNGYELVQRLISDTYLNPFDVLMLGPEASEEEIKRQHRMVSYSRMQQTRSCA